MGIDTACSVDLTLGRPLKLVLEEQVICKSRKQNSVCLCLPSSQESQAVSGALHPQGVLWKRNWEKAEPNQDSRVDMYYTCPLLTCDQPNQATR